MLSWRPEVAGEPCGENLVAFTWPEGAFSEDGVDLTLIRWMLSLTPAERLQVLQDFVDFVMKVRAANTKA